MWENVVFENSRTDLGKKKKKICLSQHHINEIFRTAETDLKIILILR